MTLNNLINTDLLLLGLFCARFAKQERTNLYIFSSFFLVVLQQKMTKIEIF